MVVPSDQLQDLRRRYYAGEDTGVSDEQWDAMYVAETVESIPLALQGVGGSFRQEVQHRIPMRGILNIFDLHQIVQWIRRLPSYVTWLECQKKIDGVAVSAHYHDTTGCLLWVGTRGEADTGEDITKNVSHLFPEKVKEGITEIRAELVIEDRDFSAYSTQYSTARNLVAGLIKRKDSQGVKAHYVQAIVYDVWTSSHEYIDPDVFNTPGSSINTFFLDCRADDAELMLRIDAEYRRPVFWKSDGVVIKVKDKQSRLNLGSTPEHSKWAVAYKQNKLIQTTVLQRLHHQVGRTGVVTPVVYFDPIDLGGAITNKATLHNDSYAIQYGVGDLIQITRSGDVIPKVTQLVQESNAPRFVPVEKCPCCSTRLVPYQTVQKRCPNTTECVEQLTEMFLYQANLFDIQGIGTAMVGNLRNTYGIQHFYQLLDIDLLQLAALGRNGVNLDGQFRSLKSRKIPLHLALAALCIEGVGIESSKKLVDHFGSINSIIKATFDDLVQVAGIGETTARDITTFFANTPTAISYLRFLRTHLNFVVPTPNSFNGVKVLITGTFSVSREEVTRVLRDAGFEVVQSGPTHLLIGSNPGAAKLQKYALLPHLDPPSFETLFGVKTTNG